MALNQELVIHFSAPKLFNSAIKGMLVFDANPVLSGVLCIYLILLVQDIMLYSFLKINLEERISSPSQSTFLLFSISLEK